MVISLGYFKCLEAILHSGTHETRVIADTNSFWQTLEPLAPWDVDPSFV